MVGLGYVRQVIHACILKDLQKGMPFKKDEILRGSTVLFKRDVLSRTCPLYIDIPTFHQGFEKEHDESSCSCEIGITIIGTFCAKYVQRIILDKTIYTSIMMIMHL